MPRTFHLNDRVWSIDCRGKTVTISWGKIGGKQQSRRSSYPSPWEAQGNFSQAIRDKRKAGYIEQFAPPPVIDATGQALEAALVDNPNDLAAHMAYADWLSEQSDPRLTARSEFIRVQLALEDVKLPTAQRRKLTRRQNALLRQHERDWMDHDLADALLDGSTGEHSYDLLPGRWTYRRGWIDSLTLNYYLNDRLAAIIAQARCLRLLQRLSILATDAGPGVVALLGQSSWLKNIRYLEIEDDGLEGREADFVRGLPHLEELTIRDFYLNVSDVVSLPNLKNLRILKLEDFSSPASLDQLAKNKSLTNLRTLILSPDQVEPYEEPAIRLPGVRALLKSPNLPALRHLVLHRSDMGDAGCLAMAHSGILGRLEILDLSCGTITDEGARILAECPELKNLKELHLEQNWLTSAGLRALRGLGPKIVGGDYQLDVNDVDHIYTNDEFDDDWE